LSGALSGPRVLLLTAFLDPNRKGHGGNRRTQQVFDLLTEAGLNVTLAAPVRGTAAEGLRRAELASVRRYMENVHGDPWRWPRIAAAFARNYGDARRGLDLHPETRVLIWEDTFNSHMAWAAKDKGLRVVAIPQNLETLAASFVDPRTQQGMPWSFEYEVSQLAIADRVYTISREEQWLLRLKGVDASYLPFFPDPVQRRRWLALRQARTGPFDRFVVLGSAYNPPTRAGIAELLTSFKNAPVQTPIHVIGLGTESLKSLESPGVTVHGSLDDAALEAHLVRAKAVILNQPAAIGALIRVSEMLLAGVPVLANPIAARSATHYAGVTIFESLPDLAPLLAGTDLPEPPIPEAPAELEGAFVRTVTDWAG
jgi:hypothetical protein